MSTTRRLLLTALPKVPLSKLTGWLTSLPLPGFVRAGFYGWFARRYGAELDDVAQELRSFRSLQAFFRRELKADARPIGATELVWPCDGKIVTAGPIDGDRIPQVKGNDYSLEDLLGDRKLAGQLAGGQQATIYLAPGDYHRVHCPFDGDVLSVRAIRGTLFPVNPPAVRCIDQLFVRNSRHVFTCRMRDGTPAAVVMVGAYNVGGTRITLADGPVARGQELGQFGFGSTVVFVLGPGAAELLPMEPEQRVRMGEAASAAQQASAQ